jgi:hypothetical protein
MKTTRNILLVFALSFMAFSAKAAVSLPLPEKEWTFLLFLNGHNNLSSYGTMNLKDMEKSGSTDKVNMVVEWGKSDDTKTHRLLVEKSKDPSKVTSPILMSRENVDMGDYHNLVDFVKWGIQNFPAKHYFVAVWNHGSGWHFQDMMRSGNGFHINDISFDDESGNHITTEQLGVAMSEIKGYLGRKVDIYGSDACLMQMIEVAAEMKDSVDYFVGSQETEPGEGWPYAPLMQGWTANPTISPKNLSILLSKEYLKAYSGGVYGRNSVTFSALDLGHLDALNNSTAALATHLKALDAVSLKKVKTAANAAQDFYYSDYKDLGDFIKRVEALQINSDKQLLTQVKTDLSKVVVTTDNSASFSAATGLSIWMPSYSSSYMERYKGLQFDKTTNWSSLITSLTSLQ